MSSSIFFRFKSRKDALQINFDGNSLSVFEIKREIMSIARLGDGKDFDLDIYTSDTNEIYEDDTTEVPRSTTVIVRRTPAQRPGAGRAARYVTGQMPLHAKNSRRVEPPVRGAGGPASNGVGDGKAMTEEERLLAVMNAGNMQLKADLEMSAGKPVIRNTFNKSAPVPDKPLPPSYVCHRCGEKGHWIQACPTNNDPNYDGKHKFKRTTGIPRSMLEIVEKPEGVGEDGKIDPTKIDKGLMYTANGEWVRARPDQATWQKFQDKQKETTEKQKEAAQGNEALRERGLECPIDKQPFADPVKTPCCGKTYCRDCIENAVLDADLTCPNCGQQVLLDNLEIDSEAVKKLAEFEAEEKASKLQKANAAPSSPKAAEDTEKEAATGSAPATPAKSPISSPKNQKKRPAEEELENDRKPAAPTEAGASPAAKQKSPTPPTGPASQQTKSQPQPPTAPKSMNDFVSQMNAMSGGNPMAANGVGMNGFPNPMMGMPMGMMGMGMPNMGMPMGMGMPPFGMMNGMGGFPNMDMGMGIGGFPNMNMNMNGMNGMGNMGWQNQQQQQPWMNNNNMQNGGGNDGAYFRQPVNPHRHQGKQRRQRSVDYKQM